ncbi:hypothetical protein SNEBB_002026 [Seison nebaliae]|nr:hypothetical protein SNEBB_002026 [Seison nebaliae]
MNLIKQLPIRSFRIMEIQSVDFEVFGRVQGVFFRKHTQKKAKSLAVNGWIMNTNNGTVKGQLEGNRAAVNIMKEWLRSEGSPKSKIDKAQRKRKCRRIFLINFQFHSNVELVVLPEYFIPFIFS